MKSPIVETLAPGDVPGFPCPGCQDFRIKLSMRDVLYSREVRCGKCGLLMSLDRSNAKKLMTLLQDVYVAEQNMSALKRPLR